MREDCPRQILFSFLHRQQLIGYGGLVYIDWQAKKAEVSVLFDLSDRSEEQYTEQLTAYLTLLKEAAFDDLGLHRLWTCLLYTSPSPRDRTRSRMPSSA